ncbi:hypothetical protein HYH03_018404 [Edaphochlamys debaryana]|uniref:Branched-chain-amino-acid aminotransferase n=1 Tax=Edaphochlamys debaryana TaxID=47281 RepID=A0A836BMY7_9CHLO|nr:hypothetical protein HYH03_018404 [Edaphochlamys debaryana]|eukprot:KAG2482666.1 hypothetical protein HYH03_018404 [Edaphochlamys debaryana]
MCMPEVPPAMFLAAVNAVVRANEAWVPPSSRGSLYLRPLLLGTGPLLGLCPAPSYTFVVYAIPVGGRAKDGRLGALDYLIHDSLHRAAPRGVGATKAAGNYSPCLMAQAEARAQGCADCIYLDAKSDTYLEEGSGCNVFAVHGRTLSTPPAAGSILPGVTRASLLALAGALGYRVRQAHISVDMAMQADEMFASGTAVVVQPIGSVTYRGKRVAFSRPPPAAAIEPTASSDLPAAPSGAPANGRANGDAVTGTPLRAPPSPSPSLSTEEDDEADYVEAYGYGTSFEYGRPVELSEEQRDALLAAAPELDRASLPPGVGPVAQRLYTLLTGIQYGRVADPFGWAVEVDMQGPTDGPLHLDKLFGLDSGTAAAAEAATLGGKGAALAAAGPGAKLPGLTPAGKSVFADPNLE